LAAFSQKRPHLHLQAVALAQGGRRPCRNRNRLGSARHSDRHLDPYNARLNLLGRLAGTAGERGSEAQQQ